MAILFLFQMTGAGAFVAQVTCILAAGSPHCWGAGGGVGEQPGLHLLHLPPHAPSASLTPGPLACLMCDEEYLLLPLDTRVARFESPENWQGFWFVLVGSTLSLFTLTLYRLLFPIA